MSLRVWLPLTKDLRNQGSDNITVTNNGATFNTNGKLGGCYKTSNSGDIDLKYSGAQINTGSLSLCGWFKFNKAELAATWGSYSFDSTRPNPTGNLIGNNSYGGVGLIWSTNSLVSGAAFTSLYVACSIRSTTNGARITNSVTIPFDTWVHLALVFNKNTKVLELWLNGELKVTSIMLDFNDARTDNLKLNYRATWGGNNPGYNIPFLVNDVRIYDHALSPLEVKQISQGLVLHYPLNRGGFGQENLSDFSSIISNWIMEGLTGSNYQDDNYGNVIKLTSSSANKRMYHNVTNVWESGQIYAVSFLAKADTNDVTCDMSRSIADFTSSFSLTTKWKKYQGIITSTATASGGTLSFRIHQSGKVVYITKIKLEKGSIATPWCPNSSDELYNTLGLNDNIQYDTSGYGNNGTKVGTFSYDSDTPKYNVSTSFNGTERIKRNTLDGEIYTLACWAKTTKNKSTSQQIIADSKSEMTISFYNGTIIGVFGTTRGRGSKSTLGSSYKENNWNHFVVVKTGTSGERAIYCNGVLLTPTNNDYWGSASGFFVGARNDSQGNPFYGQICDVRAYATALSAQDVLSLYNNSAYIDNQGNIYGAVYEEV